MKFPPIIRYGMMSFGLFFVCAGIALLVSAYRSTAEANESRNWPSTPGSIVDSRIASYTSTSDNGVSSTTYQVKVTYQYEVGAELLKGSRIYLGGEVGFDKQPKAAELQSQLENEDPLRVYYSPDDPSKAVLFPGDTSAIKVQWIVGLALLGFSILWVGVCWLITS